MVVFIRILLCEEGYDDNMMIIMHHHEEREYLFFKIIIILLFCIKIKKPSKRGMHSECKNNTFPVN